ncbi:unnamed protein product [Calicophoron daubneyi]|uniref:Uncharacterized protein n=1 Tax=Calicophoron daubneyi TaxID=300641 RepID=A0AAV2TXY0_CALDB
MSDRSFDQRGRGRGGKGRGGQARRGAQGGQFDRSQRGRGYGGRGRGEGTPGITGGFRPQEPSVSGPTEDQTRGGGRQEWRGRGGRGWGWGQSRAEQEAEGGFHPPERLAGAISGEPPQRKPAWGLPPISLPPSEPPPMEGISGATPDRPEPPASSTEAGTKKTKRKAKKDRGSSAKEKAEEKSGDTIAPQGAEALESLEKQSEPSTSQISPAGEQGRAVTAARQKKSHPMIVAEGILPTQMARISLGEKYMPKRPDNGGKLGKPCEMTVNCWDMEFGSCKVKMYCLEEIAVYNLDKSAGTKKEIRMPTKEKRALLKFVIPTLPAHAIYDGGHTVYSETQVPDVTSDGVEREMEIEDPQSRGTLLLKYRIMEVQTITTDVLRDYITNPRSTSLEMPQDSIRLLDCVFKEVSKRSYVSLGRAAVYDKEPAKMIMEKLLSIHRGFISSVRPQWKVRINVDLTYKAFLTAGNLADVVYNKYGDNACRCSRQIASDLSRIRVQTEPYYTETKTGHSYSRKFTVFGISDKPANELMIEERNQTVAEYFEQQHNIRLKYPYYPCVKVNQTRSVYIPMELLNILPYQSSNASKADIASTIIRCAAVKPTERFGILAEFVRRMFLSRLELFDRFGVKISPNPVEVNGRVLPTPKAKFSERNEMVLSRGSWIAPSFYSPANSGSQIQWAILSVPYGREDPRRDQATVMAELPKEAGKYNVIMGAPIQCAVIRPMQLTNMLQDMAKKAIDLVVLILYDENSYGEIKRQSDLILGIRTQCIRGSTLRKRGVFPNLMLKINGKLGGINWIIPPLIREGKESLMALGADVTHPAPNPRQAIRKSVAAVIGSITPDLMRYAAVVRQQATTERGNKTTREIIDNLQSMVSELIKTNARRQSGLPTKLIFYRDGVSEGQFENVLIEELRAIQRACEEIRPDYKPGITYIVVQKRHHIRFQPIRGSGDKKNGNVEAGTVVDTEVTHRREFDFYLSSQQGIQGTCKPAHYHVLYDDNDWSSDDLQLFTYFLCHAYMRCTRSVSYPAPTYYSHLAAFRAREWLNGAREEASLLRNDQFRVHASQFEGMFYL